VIAATLVDWSALGKVVVYSLVAAVGVTAVFSVGIVALERYDNRRRGGGGAIGYATLSLVCALVVAGVIVEAIVIMARK
jgi:hypothetical protein